jgi:phosphoribosyl 1,2-cyclic phosphodiesterase
MTHHVARRRLEISVNSMFVQSFGSGSSGNALLVQCSAGSLLIDCGLSPRVLARALGSRNSRLERLDAVLLTHEHDDHVRGLTGVRLAGCPLYATEGTATALGLSHDRCRRLRFEEPVEISGLTVSTLETSHDAAQPCGFSITDGETRISLLTDLGQTDDACLESIADSQLIVIEANHDVHMLRSGPYPEYLKRRVLSARGHLSNADCGTFLARCVGDSSSTRTIWLAHLSATNNRPAVAVRAVERALMGSRMRHQIVALPRGETGPVWHPAVSTSVAQLGMFD